MQNGKKGIQGMNNRIILGVFFAVLMTGCITLVSYKPNTGMKAEQALPRLERLLWEQWGAYAPNSVEVTSAYFRVVDDRLQYAIYGNMDATTVRQTFTVFFDNIGSVELYDEGNIFQVMLRDKVGSILFRYYQKNGDKAREFVDVIESLRSVSGT